MKFTFFILGLASYVLFPSISSAQEAISASGGEAKGTGGSVSYSAGQLFYMTHSRADGYVSEGVQQPYEISIVTSVNEAEGIDLAVSAFPNPVTDHLILRIDLYNLENLQYQLFDVTGRMVKNGLITGHQTLIDMRGLARGTFLLRVIDNEKEIKAFRIIKF
ncbi:MAG: T9SS type A sorting domain-containing protein [Bacteroidales bacterium]